MKRQNTEPEQHLKTDERTTCIGKYTLTEYLDLVAAFHGHVAPGLLAGGVMVDMTMDRLPRNILFDALCETPKCLPDAIQLLTPCSVGNGWLKIRDFGRFALSLYDKHTGAGFRVFLDHYKLALWPAVENWFFQLQPKNQQDSPALMEELKRAGKTIFTCHEIQVKQSYLKKKHMGNRAICTVCGEAYPEAHGTPCRACQGHSPYIRQHRISNNVADDAFAPLDAIPAAQSVGRHSIDKTVNFDPEDKAIGNI